MLSYRDFRGAYLEFQGTPSSFRFWWEKLSTVPCELPPEMLERYAKQPINPAYFGRVSLGPPDLPSPERHTFQEDSQDIRLDRRILKP